MGFVKDSLVIKMRKWDNVEIILSDGKEISLRNSSFKMRGETMFCIENDEGEGNCIPTDNIHSICLRSSSSVKKNSSNGSESSEEVKKKRKLSNLFMK